MKNYIYKKSAVRQLPLGDKNIPDSVMDRDVIDVTVYLNQDNNIIEMFTFSVQVTACNFEIKEEAKFQKIVCCEIVKKFAFSQIHDCIFNGTKYEVIFENMTLIEL